MWANLSADVEARILANPGAPIRLTAKERKSGERHWITDMAVDQRTFALIMQNLRKTAFGGAPVQTISRTASGEVRVARL